MTGKEKIFSITALNSCNWKQQEIEDLLKASNFSESVVKDLYYHKLIPNFVYILKRFGLIGYIDERTQQLLNERMVIYINRKTSQESEIINIGQAFEENNIDYVFLKGVPLRHYVYEKDPGMRISNDIDILCRPADISRAIEIFHRQLGYNSKASDTEQHVYEKMFQHVAPLEKDYTGVDLHFRLTQLGDGYSIDVDNILERKNRINGVNITSLEDTFVNLCYHHFQHEYRENRYQLRALGDIFNFLQSNEESLDWERLYTIIEQNKIEFPVAYSVYSVNEIYSLLNLEYHFPVQKFQKYFTDEFMKLKDGIMSRHLFETKPFAFWSVPYVERFFWNVWDLRTNISKEYFLAMTEKAWKKKCAEYGLDYNDVYSFTTKIWRDTGFYN